MMAFERTPDGPALDPATVSALRDALSKSLHDGAHSDGLKPVLMRATADARSKGLHAEQLLVVLKDIWYSLPELSVRKDDGQTRLLQQLIARCIQEYYGG